MKTLGFISIKGGCGKSSLAILSAKLLATAGHRVLFIDADVQNSASFHFMINAADAEKKNIAKALMDGDLLSNVIPTNFGPKLDLIPSAFGLLKLRGVSIRTLSVIMGQLDGKYDVVIVDSAPTLDNIVLNVALAVDDIVTPCAPAAFDWKTTLFLKDQLSMELGGDILGKWHVLRNMWKLARSGSPDALANQYDALLADTVGKYLLETKVLETAFVKQAIDFSAPLTAKGKSEKIVLGLAALLSEVLEIQVVKGGV